MIKSLEIRNFRGYKSLSLSELPRFNFLIGKSGSGKTALLEALWIVGGVNPEIYFRMRAMRGLASPALQIRNERRAYETFFREVFFEPSLSSGAEIRILDSNLTPRSLNIYYGQDGGQLPLNIDVTAPSGGSTDSIKPMMFFWRVADKEYPCPLVLSPTGQFFSPTQPPAFPAYFISPSHLMDPVESATRLSEIRVNKNYDPVIEAIKSIYPHVKSVSPEIIGGQPAIWAGIEGIEKELPLPVISSGIAKFVSIALLVQHPGALLIIDEIENSFYFGDYEPILNGIVYFCTKNEVQLVASTHSYEFLEAVAKVMRGRESDFSLLHSVRGKNGECSLSVMPGLSSRNTIEQQIELR